MIKLILNINLCGFIHVVAQDPLLVDLIGHHYNSG